MAFCLHISKKCTTFAGEKIMSNMTRRKTNFKSRKSSVPKVWMLTVIIGLLVAGLSLWLDEQRESPSAVEESAVPCQVESATEIIGNQVVAELSDTQSVAYEMARVTTGRPEQVITHVGYTVSYNPEWRVPNWVAYELTDFESGGEEKRSNHFLPDPLVEGDPVVTADYKNSGYDRGHMAPAADMKWSEQAMRESFYMTNMCPQLHNLNAGDWKSLEDLGREWARKYGSVYIACGPIVEEGFSTIGTERKIAIPSAFFKVFLRRKGNGWTSIGFVMANEAGSKPLMTYMMSVNEIEERTNIDLFYLLPDDIEEEVESCQDPSDWALKRK